MHVNETGYRETEADFLNRWNQKTAIENQHNQRKIPGWLNVPAKWIWLQFCSARGWLFTDKASPHVYSDGRMDSERNWIAACDIPGVMFFSNSKNYLGESAPFWVIERRELAKEQP